MPEIAIRIVSKCECGYKFDLYDLTRQFNVVIESGRYKEDDTLMWKCGSCDKEYTFKELVRDD